MKPIYSGYFVSLAILSVMSPTVINMLTRELLAGVTKNYFDKCFGHLNRKSNVCKQISVLFVAIVGHTAFLDSR